MGLIRHFVAHQRQMLLPQLQYPAGRIGGRTADLTHPPEKKLQPGFPMPGIADGHKPVVILGPMEFEIMAQIQQWKFQNATLTQQKRNQQPSDAPVAVQERVNRLELGVSQSTDNQ